MSGTTLNESDALDDAQAMALVKLFSLDIEAPYIGQPNWMVAHENGGGCDPDSNRAIVMCVAAIREGNK